MKKIGFVILAILLVSQLWAQENPVAIKNARILTVTHGVIEKGHLLIHKGKITDIGTDIQIPAAAQILEAEGMLEQN